ncbi:MAG: GHKL domain-containing protein [Pseudomonadales bacterium]|nr:GHKL domain-containing protein [Pseudomonadales bacterium]
MIFVSPTILDDFKTINSHYSLGFDIWPFSYSPPILERIQQSRQCLLVLHYDDAFHLNCLREEVQQLINASVKAIAVIPDTDSTLRHKIYQQGFIDYIQQPLIAAECKRIPTYLEAPMPSALKDRDVAIIEQLRHTVNSLKQGIIGLDSQSCISSIDSVAENLIDCKSQNLMGMPISNIIPELHHASDNFLQLIASGDNLILKNSLITNNLDIKLNCEITISPIFQGHEISGALLAFSPVNENSENPGIDQAVEQQRRVLAHFERMSTMGEMATGFAHEINQPLTAIVNFSSVANRLALKSPINIELLQDTLGNIQQQAHRSGEIMKHLRSFVRKPIACKERVCLYQLIKDVIALSDIEAKRCDGSIQLHQQSKQELFIIGHNIELQQVLLNLIRNGLEAMQDKPAEHSKLHIYINTDDEDTAQIRIVDQGTGFADDAEQYLFTPFYTTKKNGMGIGLTVCLSIINAHNGVINYQREKNGGASFTIKLPCFEHVSA